MANNSTDINKTNNYLSHQLVEQMKNEAYDVRNRGHGFGQVHKYGGIKPGNEIPISTWWLYL